MGMPAPVQPTPVANGETKQEDIDISPGKCIMKSKKEIETICQKSY